MKSHSLIYDSLVVIVLTQSDRLKEWEDFINQNLNMSKDIKLAEKIDSALRFSPKDPDEGDIYEIY